MGSGWHAVRIPCRPLRKSSVVLTNATALENAEVLGGIDRNDLGKQLILVGPCASFHCVQSAHPRLLTFVPPKQSMGVPLTNSPRDIPTRPFTPVEGTSRLGRLLRVSFLFPVASRRSFFLVDQWLEYSV